MFSLSRAATVPFCLSQAKGSIAVKPTLSFHRKLWRSAGPGLLVSVGYRDPGNWATDIEGGSPRLTRSSYLTCRAQGSAA